MKTLPFLLILAACAEDPHVAEITGLRGIIAQNDIDKTKAAEECGIVRGDYDQASRERDACWARGNNLEVFVLAYVTLAGIKADEVYVCHDSPSDANFGTPRSPWITTDGNDLECQNRFTVRLVFDATGKPSFAPSED